MNHVPGERAHFEDTQSLFRRADRIHGIEHRTARHRMLDLEVDRRFGGDPGGAGRRERPGSVLVYQPQGAP